MTINIVKVGGAIVEKEDSLSRLLNDFSLLEGNKILVHGGGRLATTLATQMGVETRMVEGRRVTDADTLRIVTMVYGGLINKQIVAQLQARHVNAVGLTGADAGILLSHRRPPVVIKVKEPILTGIAETGTTGTSSAASKDCFLVDYGFVGDVDRCDAGMLSALIGQGLTPVVAPLTHDGEGQLLNTNADTIASVLARGLADRFDVTLTFCFEKKGVLRDADDEDSVIPQITAADFVQLRRDEIVQGGMIPKIENALEACRAGVKRVIITRADQLGQPDTGTVVML